MRAIGRQQYVLGVSIVAVMAAMISSASAQQPAERCSLRCESQRAKPITGVSAFNVKGIEATNKQIRTIMYTRTAMGLTLRGKGMALSIVAGTAPGGGGVATIIDKGYEATAAVTEKAITDQLTQLVVADVQYRLKSGEAETDVRVKLSANAKATIDSLIGPNSAYPDIAKEATTYDALQDGAIRALAEKLDDVILKANSTDVTMEAVRAQVLANTKGLKQVRDQLAAARAKAAETTKDDLSQAAHAAEKAAPQTAAAKTEAVQRTMELRAVEVAKAAQAAAGQFDAAATILNNVGASKDAVQAVSMLGAIANVTAGIASSLVNPLAILPTIASATALFGGGQSPGPDPQMVAILASLEQLHQQLNELRTEIQGYHKAEMQELGKIQTGLVGLLGVMNEQEDAQLRQCNNVIPKKITFQNQESIALNPDWAWDEPPGARTFDGILLNATHLRPVTYQGIVDEWSAKFDAIKACHDALQKTLTQYGLPGRFAITDLLGQIEAGKTSLGTTADVRSPSSPHHERYLASLAVKQWIDSVAPVIARSKQIAMDGRHRSIMSWSLANPAFSIIELDAKGKDLAQSALSVLNDASLSQSSRREYDDWVTGHAADADLITRVAGYSLLASWWREFRKPGEELRGPNEVGIKSADPVIDELTRAGDALRIAVAQQAAVSGDLLLLLFYERLGRGDTSVPVPDWFGPSPGKEADSDDQKRVNEASTWWSSSAATDFDVLLNSNAVANANFGLLYASKRRNASKTTLTQYDVAWASSDPDSMALVLGKAAGSYVRDKEGWVLRRTYTPTKPASDTNAPNPRQYDIRLPTPDELRAGALHHTRSFQAAVTQWGQVEQELVVYTYLPTDPTEAQQAVEAAQVRGLAF